jgi:hypothetical protein
MVGYAPGLGNQWQLNGGDINAVTGKWWPGTAARSVG